MPHNRMRTIVFTAFDHDRAAFAQWRRHVSEIEEAIEDQPERSAAAFDPGWLAERTLSRVALDDRPPENAIIWRLMASIRKTLAFSSLAFATLEGAQKDAEFARAHAVDMVRARTQLVVEGPFSWALCYSGAAVLVGSRWYGQGKLRSEDLGDVHRSLGSAGMTSYLERHLPMDPIQIPMWHGSVRVP